MGGQGEKERGGGGEKDREGEGGNRVGREREERR